MKIKTRRCEEMVPVFRISDDDHVALVRCERLAVRGATLCIDHIEKRIRELKALRRLSKLDGCDDGEA